MFSRVLDKLIDWNLKIENGKAIVKDVMDEPQKKKCPAKNWVKRFGALGFVFFLVKGLLWLIVPAAIAYFSLN